MNTTLMRGTIFNWTQGIYALHAFSLLTGILGAATVVGAFLLGWPSIIAVVLNYVKRSEARDTWLESHFGGPRPRVDPRVPLLDLAVAVDHHAHALRALLRVGVGAVGGADRAVGIA